MSQFTQRGTASASGEISDLGLEKSEWTKCDLYFPRQVARKIIQQVMAANDLLAALEIEGETFGIFDPRLVDWRCVWIGDMLRIATNTKEHCQRCIVREQRPVRATRPVQDPDCD